MKTAETLLTHSGGIWPKRGDLLTIGGSVFRVVRIESMTTLRVRPATWFWRMVAEVRWRLSRARDAVIEWWFEGEFWDEWDRMRGAEAR